jgi:signal peptidase I
MLTLFDPQSAYPFFLPARYAYFREGDLYVMGAPILKKDDATLIAFNAQEAQKTALSPPHRPYLPFKDYGPPMKEGVIDKEFLQTFGLQIPDKMYLALGDNYASSSDSRDFGFVPEENLRGGPTLIVWPPGPRWGLPAQPSHPLFTVPVITVWSLLIIITAVYCIYRHVNNSRPVYRKLSDEK